MKRLQHQLESITSRVEGDKLSPALKKRVVRVISRFLFEQLLEEERRAESRKAGG
ncbi:MAG: hypothetical protein HN348_03530 [Proteobacteria bacterium]|jgi:hypothetical protein|nr:hypothetical protein [Pseudomonadota bacterium]